jgi:hypothetical protein
MADGIDGALEHAIRRLASGTTGCVADMFRQHMVSGQPTLDPDAVFKAVNRVWNDGGGCAAAKEVARSHKRASDFIVERPGKRCRALPASFFTPEADEEYVPATPAD